MHDLLESITAIARAAGEEILAVYNDSRPIDVTVKDDQSPLTLADERANALIVERLSALDHAIPIISEEMARPDFSTRSRWQRFWLVDPLDGTREFIRRNDEFTVNIALIEQGEPVLGVVHLPVPDVSYFGGVGSEGAWKRERHGDPQPLTVSSLTEDLATLRIVASRSHRGQAVDRLIEKATGRFADIDVVTMGSSIKICLLAEGKADLYPRLAPTSEWDTAAAHAVLKASGGDILTTKFERLRYNQKEDILNPHFLAIADCEFDWRALLGTEFE